MDFTNFREHPSNNSLLFYFFREEQQAEYYASLLDEENLFYERQTEVKESGQILHCFITKKKDNARTRHLNNLAIGKYRSKFIPDKGLRLFVIALGLLVMGVAIAGYFLS